MEDMNGYIILAIKKMKYSSFSDKAVILAVIFVGLIWEYQALKIFATS